MTTALCEGRCDPARSDALRIALVAPSRYPVREPFAGGLEAMVASVHRALLARGHAVELFAVEGSPGVSDRFAFRGVRWGVGEVPSDHGYPAGGREAETGEFVALAEILAGSGFDVVHNNSLHPHLPAVATHLPAPLLTTLHTPPFPEMQGALSGPGARPGALVAVSGFTARQWVAPDPIGVVSNGVCPRTWAPGPGGRDLVWAGRLTPDKGVHVAIAAARLAGRRLMVAGRVGDPAYMDTVVAPMLGDGVEYVGHLEHRELAALIGRSACALVTPSWDEPFGLVAAEALACGTPVAALPRGGLPDVTGPFADEMIARGTGPEDLAEAVLRAEAVPRERILAYARDALTEAAMVRSYEARYRALVRA